MGVAVDGDLWYDVGWKSADERAAEEAGGGVGGEGTQRGGVGGAEGEGPGGEEV